MNDHLFKLCICWFSLTIILWGGKGPKECIEYGLMKQNGLLQDIKKNGLLNKGGLK